MRRPRLARFSILLVSVADESEAVEAEEGVGQMSGFWLVIACSRAASLAVEVALGVKEGVLEGTRWSAIWGGT